MPHRPATNASLTTQKTKLEAEQVKLLQAHYADATTIDLLKTEQDRIRASLHAITTRLDELATTYDKAKVGLDTILSILTDLGDLYAKAEPAERRMLNQALFDRIILEDDDTATITPKQAVATILASDPSPHNEQTLPRDHAGQGSNVSDYVELRVCWFMTSFTSDESRHRSYPPRFHDGACPGNVSSCCRSSSRACPKLKRHASSR